MAKKKSTRQSNATVNVNNDEKATKRLSRQCSMEEESHEDSSPEEKVQHLKSLNAMLLKQTVEKRQQIDSLAQAKTELETERGELRSELDEVSDENLGLRMELGLVMDFVGCRFREMGVGVRERDDEIRVLKEEVEVDRERLREVCGERDAVKKRLEENVAVLVEKEASLGVVIEGLKGEKEERRMREEIVNKEKVILEKEIEVLLGVKNEMEIVKIDQRREIEDLERKLEKMNDSVDSLRKQEKVLRGVVVELEKNLDESIEKERGMMVHIDSIGKEKTVKESELERLMEKKSSVEKQMEIVSEQCLDKEKLIDELSREKIELEERVFTGEAKHVELNRKVDELERAVSALQKDRTETSEELSCKVGELRDALEQVELEREKAGKALDEEKRRGADLKADVSKSEKMIETTLEELEKVKTERESLSRAKNVLEKQYDSVRSEKTILEKELLQRSKAIDALKKEVASAGMEGERSLVMLKSTASAVSQSDSEEQKQGNGTESYASELESIEKAFKNKENIIEEMKKEAEAMKLSTEEAHKKKSFWTAVSSVTTIFAAASFAYASRTR